MVRASNAKRFIHLHLHTEYSPLDGLTTVSEAVNAVIADGQDALAVTDHGVCASHLELQMVAKAAGIKPIFGLEAYLVDDHRARGAEVLKEYWHFILWATTRRGLDNLWALSTQAYIEGFYGHPRMDWEMLAAHSEGIAASTACMRGPLADDILHEREDLVIDKVGKLQAIYGDRLFVELHTNGTPEQVKLNRGAPPGGQEPQPAGDRRRRLALRLRLRPRHPQAVVGDADQQVAPGRGRTCSPARSTTTSSGPTRCPRRCRTSDPTSWPGRSPTPATSPTCAT